VQQQQQQQQQHQKPHHSISVPLMMFLSSSRHGVIRTAFVLSKTAPASSGGYRQFSTRPVPGGRNVVVVSGVRLPFAQASTIYQDEMAVDLQRMAITGLINQTALPKDAVDYVVCGSVIQEVRTSNIAREAAVNAGLPYNIGAHTVAQACISANAAIATGATAIQTGHANVVIAGGVETFSDVPIRLSRKIRQKLISLPKAMKKGGPIGAVRHMLKGLQMKDLSLETPAIANYTTGEVMGVSSDKLSAKFGISRQEQDEFTVRSHTLAQKAHDDGFYKDEIAPYKGSTEENGIKGDSTIESVGKLKPAFIKPYGTHTAANSSFLTDGAAATLLMSEEKAKELGYKPWAYLRDWSFEACDPWEELLLGKCYKYFMNAFPRSIYQLSSNCITIFQFFGQAPLIARTTFSCETT
jgi:acetyl-CoA acyltransferase